MPISTQGIYLVLGGKPLDTWSDGFYTDTPEWGLCRAAFHASVPYHCPTWLAKWVLSRRYPFQVVTSAEGGASYCWLKPDGSGSLFHWMWKDTANRDANTYVLPAWHSRLVNYQTAHYSLGTASRMFNDGMQNNSFVITVPLAKPMTSVHQVVRVHARYIVDESVPGVTLMDDFMRRVKRQNNFPEAGRTICLQHQGTAMVLYRSQPVNGYKPRRLRAVVLFPNRDAGEGKPSVQRDLHRQPCVGDLQGQPQGESSKSEPVYVRIDNTYMAFIPLINNQAAGKRLEHPASVRVGPAGKSLGISFYNYEGEPLAMNPRQFCMLGNGFICETGSSDEGSFDDFRRRFGPRSL